MGHKEISRLFSLSSLFFQIFLQSFCLFLSGSLHPEEKIHIKIRRNYVKVMREAG